MKLDENTIVGDCPICDCALTDLIEDSEEIRECDGCGAEWEQSNGTITLDPREL
jgi:hypothetical protein